MEQLKAFIAREPESNGNTKGTFNYAEYKALTLELPYHDNQQKISCIPNGTYLCKKVGATRIPYPHISITNVPNREGIAIHYGNYAGPDKSDVLGCVLVGSGYGDLNSDGVPEILNSKNTFEALMKAVPDEFVLVISQ